MNNKLIRHFVCVGVLVFSCIFWAGNSVSFAAESLSYGEKVEVDLLNFSRKYANLKRVQFDSAADEEIRSIAFHASNSIALVETFGNVSERKEAKNKIVEFISVLAVEQKKKDGHPKSIGIGLFEKVRKNYFCAVWPLNTVFCL
ncbi:MAG: hypothetical protein QF451_17285 [Nitrospinota bacterium]|nr:hypothetical protein [Nitrospinota bacterium]